MSLSPEQLTLPRKVYYASPVPRLDDFGSRIEEEFIDGRTEFGPWAIMTPASWRRVGRPLGMGSGQRYAKQSDGRWLKVEG